MNNVRSNRNNVGDGLRALWRDVTRGRHLSRGASFGMIIIGALLAFEIFNYSTTQFALLDVLGDLTFAGFRWATILAIAFCGIDFAGIARIFTPQQGRDEPAEVWYLFGAWLLAAAFNATLTWWGVSVAIVNHQSAAANAVVSNSTLIKVVPIFVAVMVWLIRVLIIGTFSVSGDNLFSTADAHSFQPRSYPQQNAPRPIMNQTSSLRTASSLPRPGSYSAPTGQVYHPVPKPVPQSPSFTPAEPTYHNLSFDASSSETGQARKQ
jgi:hypothetical protein